MSWAQLYDQIRAMSHEERLQPVRFVEGYDEGVILPVSFERAQETLTRGEGEDQITIRKGEPFLW